MDVLDKFLKKYSYKFDKGYPDMGNPKDKEMLFEFAYKLSETEKIIKESSDVYDKTILRALGTDSIPQSKNKYQWNGTPRHRQWLTYNEWRGKHCRSNKQRKAFRKWKKREMDSFVDYMCMAAVDECKIFPDIPPELIVAQAILESNFGKSRLAVEGNNLFGHKYRGKNKHLFLIAADDSPNDRFTKYRSLWFSIRNHTKLLMKKYRKRISHQPTLGRWLYALCGGMTVAQSKRWRVKGNSVYATSCMTEVCYSQKLRNVINVYSLTERCSKIK